jgi:hypothetical protein
VKPDSNGGIRSAIVEIVNAARVAAARNSNALMTATYWEIGHRIVEAEQHGRRRAGYGEQWILRLSGDLTRELGRGFSARNLEQIRQFYLAWPISQTLSAESANRLSSPARCQKSQTVSAQLVPERDTAVRSSNFSLAELAQSYPLSWSAYMRLLAIKTSRCVAKVRGVWFESHFRIDEVTRLHNCFLQCFLT